MEIKTKYFGSSIYSKEDGADFEVTNIELNNKTSDCNLMIFDGLDDKKIQKALSLLDNLNILDDISRKEITTSYKSDDTVVSDFINEHFNDYGEDITKEIFEKLNINKQNDIAFIENLELGTVAISEDAKHGICVTLDYNVLWEDGISFTDQVLTTTFNDEKKFLSLAHES